MSEEKKVKKAPAKGGAAGEAGAPNYSNKKVKIAWTLVRCKKFARRFVSEKAWKAGAPSSYKAAQARGWVKECASVFRKPGAPLDAGRRKTAA